MHNRQAARTVRGDGTIEYVAITASADFDEQLDSARRWFSVGNVTGLSAQVGDFMQSLRNAHVHGVTAFHSPTSGLTSWPIPPWVTLVSTGEDLWFPSHGGLEEWASPKTTFSKLLTERWGNLIPDVSGTIDATLFLLTILGVRLVDLSGIRRYLTENPDMTELLPKVHNFVRNRLGQESQISVQVYSDPEIEDEYLLVYIRQNDYGEDFLDLISSVRSDYKDDLESRSGWIHITTDFQPPG